MHRQRELRKGPYRYYLGWAVLLLMIGSVGCTTEIYLSGLGACFRNAVGELRRTGAEEIRRECNTGARSGATIVVFPYDPVSATQLGEAGVSREDINIINDLQKPNSQRQRINVLPNNPKSSGWDINIDDRKFDVPELMVCKTPATKVTITLRQEHGRIVWRGME